VLFFFTAGISFQIVDEMVVTCYRWKFQQLRKLFVFFDSFSISGLYFANSSLYTCFSKGLFMGIFVENFYKEGILCG